MSTNVSVTITGTYPSYVVTFSDGGQEIVPYNTTKNIIYGFASGTTGFQFVGLTNIVKSPTTTKDTISSKVSTTQLTVTGQNNDKTAAVIGYMIEFRDSAGHVFNSPDPEIIFEPD